MCFIGLCGWYITGVIYGTRVDQRSEPGMWSQFQFLKVRVLTPAPGYMCGFVVILEMGHGHTSVFVFRIFRPDIS